MSSRRWVQGALLFLGAACRDEPAPVVPEGPVEWSVVASVDKHEIQVGEDLDLTLTLMHPAEGNFVPPPGSAFQPFDVIGTSEEKVSPVETRLHYRLAAYRLPEDLQIPALEIRYREGASDEAGLLETDPIPVKLVTSLTPDVTDIHDIKGPIDLLVPRDFRLLIWLLLALLAAVLAYLIYRKLRKEPSEAAPVWSEPLPPPDVEAMAALERLRGKELVEKGEIRAFYTELAEIVKRYAGRRFEVPYLERTTSEVLLVLRPKKLSPDTISELHAILDVSDLVKFAKLVPEAAEAERCFCRASEWVQSTRPAPAPAPPAGAETLGATA